jgi:hypothetical protein
MAAGHGFPLLVLSYKWMDIPGLIGPLPVDSFPYQGNQDKRDSRHKDQLHEHRGEKVPLLTVSPKQQNRIGQIHENHQPMVQEIEQFHPLRVSLKGSRYFFIPFFIIGHQVPPSVIQTIPFYYIRKALFSLFLSAADPVNHFLAIRQMAKEAAKKPARRQALLLWVSTWEEIS